MKKLQLEWVMRYWRLWPIVAGLISYGIIMILSIGQSVWFDEGYSILIAQKPVSELLILTGVDAHPPLYYLLLKIWGTVFSWNEYALRSLSAVFTAGAVIAAFFLMRRLFTIRVALATLPFIVLAPFVLRFGYEIRMYALALCIGVLASLVLVYAKERQKRRLWIIYAVLVALGMYTLYMLIALWIAHVVWLFATTKEKRAIYKQPWIFSYVGAIILFLPYLTTFLYQYTHSALPGIGTQLTVTKIGGALSTLVVYQPDWAVNGIVSLLLLAMVGLVISLQVGIQRLAGKRDRKSLFFLYCLAFVPIIFFAGLSILSPIYIHRYLAHVSIYLYVLLGVTIALGYRYGLKVRSFILMVIAGGLLIFGLVNLYQSGNYVFERLQKPSTAEARSRISCDSSVVVTNDPYTYIDSIYYFKGCDVRFASQEPVEKKGGYAPLAGSSSRIENTEGITSPVIYFLHWKGGEQSISVDDRYRLTTSEVYDQQVVDTYVIEE